MRICFVTNEIFNWGVYGGFGSYTRYIGKELAKRGFEVFVLVPRRAEQKTIEILDGMVVIGYSNAELFSGKKFLLPQADIYHFIEPFVSAYFVIRATPDSKHLIDFQDPLDKEDIKRFSSENDPLFNDILKRFYFCYIRPLVLKRAVLKADSTITSGKFLIPKIKKMYCLKEDPIVVPPPLRINIPAKVNKSPVPTVCFLGRWDPQKRVERFFKLAEKFPHIRFIAAGRATNPQKDKILRKQAPKIANLELPGWVDEDTKAHILEESWIYVNTSIHEGLPTAFNEASVYRLAVLSAENPDGYASNYGFRVVNDDFESGLDFLLKDDCWKEKGEKGYDYASRVHDPDNFIRRCIQIYEGMIKVN
jgi:glycosyltransferase involved in cell wall biosynthesis